MINLYQRKWTRHDLARYVGSMDQLAGVKALQATEGVERGGRVLEVWTGSGLHFHILADRALDISSCQYKGMSLAWRSSVGDTHPSYYDASGSEWLRSFQGGLLVTCGLDTFGPPNRDGEELLGLHGRISNVPGRAVNYSTTWVDGEYRLEVSGEVRQTRVFGENLVLRRHISTALGSNCIRIEDVITNEGFTSHPHMILYHVNAGFPLLSETARLKLNADETMLRSDASRRGINDWMVFQQPTPGYLEQNFIHKPIPDETGWAVAELENPELRIGLRLAFDMSTLPYMNEWKMMGEGLYVLGIEPMNCAADRGRGPAREQALLPVLKAGESRRYRVEIEVVDYL